MNVLGESWMFLVKRASPLLELPVTRQPVKTLQAATTNCVFELTPDTLVKVSPWIEGLQSEGRTIDFVNSKFPNIPARYMEYHWVDQAWSRSFIVMRRVQGYKLDSLWPYMTEQHKREVAAIVAGYAEEMASSISNEIRTVDGHGHSECLLLGDIPFDLLLTQPNWTPYLHQVHTPQSLKQHIVDQSEPSCGEIEIGSPQVFAHPELHPGNVLVNFNDQGRVEVKALIDWESAGYWPSFWVATVAHDPGGLFHIRKQGNTIGRWDRYLTAALQERGFSSQEQWLWRYAIVKEELRRQRASKEWWAYVQKLREKFA